jgi:outer membrane lipopolysaccharide assembly protein LptE/RlpB
MKRLLAPLSALAALVLLSGCAGYRLGSMLPADVRTVHMPTCENNTSEPLIEQDVTRAILSQIQIDGSLRVADADTADSILEVTLIQFWLDPVAYAKNESSTANQYRMSIRAAFVLRRRADNSVVVESPGVTGWYDFDFAGDMTSSKAVALRPAAEDLGRRIVSRIVQYWP